MKHQELWEALKANLYRQKDRLENEFTEEEQAKSPVRDKKETIENVINTMEYLETEGV